MRAALSFCSVEEHTCLHEATHWFGLGVVAVKCAPAYMNSLYRMMTFHSDRPTTTYSHLARNLTPPRTNTHNITIPSGCCCSAAEQCTAPPHHPCEPATCILITSQHDRPDHSPLLIRSSRLLSSTTTTIQNNSSSSLALFFPNSRRRSGLLLGVLLATAHDELVQNLLCVLETLDEVLLRGNVH